MTIAAVVLEAGPFSGNGVTTAFPFTFKCFAKQEMTWTRRSTLGVESVLVLDLDYSVALNPDQNTTPGGTVTFPLGGSAYAILATGEKLVGVSNAPETQLVDLVSAGGWFPEVVENALDRAVLLVQQLSQLLTRTLSYPVTDPVVAPLPTSTQRANKFLAFDASGNPVAVDGSDGTSGSLAVALATSAGATLIGWIQAGVGAVRRTVTAKLFDFVHIKDYGAACDGVTVDTAAINAALSANPNRTIYINGTPLIDATIFIDGRQKIIFEGGPDAGDSSPPASYFKKKAGMAAVGVVLGFGGFLEGGGIACAGATLGGLQVRGNTARVRNFTIFGSTLDLLSGIGCRVGDTIGTNTNSWLLDHVSVSAMGGDAFWFHDGTIGGANVNAGLAVGCEALVNGGRGFVMEHASLNTLFNCLSESNVGHGVHFVGGIGTIPGIGNCWKFGDSEGNAAGDPNRQIVIDQGVNGTQIDSSPFTQVTDNGYFSKRLDRYNDKQVDFVPSFWGSTGATKTGTSLVMVGTTATIGSVAHGYANGDTIAIGITAGTIANLDGAFVIRNVTANTFDVTCRTDRAKDLPVSAGVIATSLQRCGVYSACHGRYTFRGTDIEFDLDMTTSALTNLTGVIGIILPWDCANQSGGVGPTVIQSMAVPYFYTGITHTGLLTLPIAHNGGRVKILQNNIGSGLAPAQLGAAGLAAATRVLMSGRYHAFDR